MKVEITQEWVDKAKDLAHQYAIDYSFVIAGSHNALFEHLQSALSMIDANAELKPYIMGVTLDDGTIIEFPEPVRAPLDYGEFYYICESEGCISRYSWSNSDQEMLWLKQHRIYKKEEDCKTAEASLNKIIPKIYYDNGVK